MHCKNYKEKENILCIVITQDEYKKENILCIVITQEEGKYIMHCKNYK